MFRKYPTGLLAAALLLLTHGNLSCVPDQAIGQDAESRWEKSIAEFEERDRTDPPAKDGILFVGSSSIRMWKTDGAFPERNVINRGFGGSQISDVNRFVDRIVLNYEPRVIVFYAGDNDVASGQTADQVAAEYDKFLASVAEKLPRTQVIYLPIKPSPRRWEMWTTMNEANQAIRARAAARHNWRYVDTATPMLGEDGKPRPELFLDDGLHLNEAGYELWTELVTPRLDRAVEAAELTVARGVVYHDENGNRAREQGEKGLAGVRVSNGREIVTTDDQGSYALPVSDDEILFVIKPRGWRTPISQDQLPRFYYIHKPNGSPPLQFPGVAPTGPLPDSVDFALYPQEEPRKFQAIMFGDPQPRNQQEVDYVTHDVVEELIGTKASFGVTLGDITFDNLDLFESQNRAIALLGIPWYNVIGNHDINYDARHDAHSDETFERVFGPAYYSFDYGTVHFIVLDDIEWFVPNERGNGRYRGGLGTRQMEFVRNDLAGIPDNQLVVLMMHIPLVDVRDRHDLYRLIERRPFCMSISGHTHHHEHRYIKREDGWLGPEPHHHVINVTVSGSWWSGTPDERGIPHTMMADGAPNGYSIITFDGTDYRVDFKAAGRPRNYQMLIHAPEQATSDTSADTTVFVNVFNGSEKSKVEMRVVGQGGWTELTRSVQRDPHYLELVEAERRVENRNWRDLPAAKPSPHLWKGPLPAGLPPGTHRLVIRATDRHGRVHRGSRAIRIIASTAPAEAPPAEVGATP